MNTIKLGKFLSELRSEKKMTQAELAEKLFVDSNKVSRWECGNSIPDFASLIEISKIFNVTLFELSICERLKDKTLLDKTKDKLKTLKDVKKIELRKKVTYFIAGLFGFLFGLTLLFTIQNYNRVHVYTLHSLDENFKIEGVYIKTNGYQSLTISNIIYIGTDEKTLNIKGRNIFYRISTLDKKVLKSIRRKDNYKINKIVNVCNELSLLNVTDNMINIPSDNLIFEIMYDDGENNFHNLQFKFELSEKYNNRFWQDIDSTS